MQVNVRVYSLLTVDVERHRQRFPQTPVVDEALDGHVFEQPRMEEQCAGHNGGAITLALGRRHGWTERPVVPTDVPGDVSWRTGAGSAVGLHFSRC